MGFPPPSLSITQRAPLKPADSLHRTQISLFPTSLAKTEFYQGNVGDCQLLVCLYGLSRNPSGRALLEQMIQKTDNGQYIVTFPQYPQHPITVNDDELQTAISYKQPWLYRVSDKLLGFTDRPQFKQLLLSLTGSFPSFTHLSDAPYATGDPGIQLLEIAYARLTKKLNPTAFSEINESNITEIYNHPQYHSSAWIALQNILNQPVKHFAVTEVPSAKSEASFRDYCYQSPTTFSKLVETLNQIALQPGRFVATACVKYQNNIGCIYYLPDVFLSTFHDYTITGVDATQRRITLVDPHNTQATPIKITYDQFFDAFNELNVAWMP